VRFLKESLDKAGFTVVDDGLKVLWNPTEESRQQCHEYALRLAAALA
jgi:anaerobic nitric oxide reductase flavorubredoxin